MDVRVCEYFEYDAVNWMILKNFVHRICTRTAVLVEKKRKTNFIRISGRKKTKTTIKFVHTNSEKTILSKSLTKLARTMFDNDSKSLMIIRTTTMIVFTSILRPNESLVDGQVQSIGLFNTYSIHQSRSKTIEKEQLTINIVLVLGLVDENSIRKINFIV